MNTRHRVVLPALALAVFALAAGFLFPLSARAESKGLKLLEEIDQAVSEVVQSVLPTVVNISSSKTQEADNPLAGSPLEEFFHFYNRRGNEPRSFKSYSLGSGIIVDGKKGYILTNNHVVEGAEEIFVDFFAPDGSVERFEGEAFNDPKTELALVKIKDMKGKTLPEARLGNSDSLKVGHMVLAIGSPFQKSQSVSRGIVSALGRQESGPQFERVIYKDFIQTDAAINQGNSGGPLLNIYGEVIGINTYIYSTSGGAQGVGFAIPVKWAKPVIEQLSTTGKVIRPYLGIKMITTKQLPPERREQFGIDDTRGVVVDTLYSNSPAEQGGLQVADVLLEFDGETVETSQGLQLQVLKKKVSDTVPIKVWRPSTQSELTVQVTLGEQPDTLSPFAEAPQAPSSDRLGMALSPLTPERARKLQVSREEGLVVDKVESGSAADREGIRSGDILLRADYKNIAQVSEFDRILDDLKENGKSSVLIEVLRGSLRFMAVLPLEKQ